MPTVPLRTHPSAVSFCQLTGPCWPMPPMKSVITFSKTTRCTTPTPQHTTGAYWRGKSGGRRRTSPSTTASVGGKIASGLVQTRWAQFCSKHPLHCGPWCFCLCGGSSALTTNHEGRRVKRPTKGNVFIPLSRCTLALLRETVCRSIYGVQMEFFRVLCLSWSPRGMQGLDFVQSVLTRYKAKKFSLHKQTNIFTQPKDLHFIDQVIQYNAIEYFSTFFWRF